VAAPGSPPPRRAPSLTAALLTIGAVVAVIVAGISLQRGINATFFPLLVATGLVGIVGLALGNPWTTIEDGVFRGAASVTIAIVVLLLIGALVGLWILSGTIPSLLYYGLQLMSPAFFLPTAFLVCCVTSLTIGSSFGTIAVAGVALIGVQTGFAASAPITAGAIIGGAYFGDKMSPLSDSTNVAAAIGETDLFSHIRSMVYTTFPATLLVLALLWIAGSTADASEAGAVSATMLDGLRVNWNASWIHLLPAGIMLALAAWRLPAVPMLFLSVVLAAVWAMVFQDASLTTVFSAATSGYVAQTGVDALDAVLTRGGMSAMSAVVLLVLLAAALGGALEVVGILDRLVKGLLDRIRSTGSLIVAVLASCYTVILLTGNQMLAIILPGQMFLPAFRRRGIEGRVLTRTLEDAGTISAPMVPWSVAGAYATQMLGVPTLDYLPYMWFAFLVPVFSVLYGFTGFAVWRTSEAS